MLGALLPGLLQEGLLPELCHFACASRVLREAVEVGARLTSLHLCGAMRSTDGLPWVPLSALLRAAAIQKRKLVVALHLGLFEEERLRSITVALADGALRAITGAGASASRTNWASAVARRVLGAEGPAAMLPVQRKLLRSLGFQVGALRPAIDLARLSAAKAKVLFGRKRVSVLDVASALLDLAEVLNHRAYMRTFVSSSSHAVAELEEAVRVVEEAQDLLTREGVDENELEMVRARLLLARTTTSAAHAWALDVHDDLDASVQKRWAKRWTDSLSLFRRALATMEGLLQQVDERAASDSAAPVDPQGVDWQLLKGAVRHQLGEIWFCGAAAMDHGKPFQGQLAAETPQSAVQKSMAWLEEAVEWYQSIGRTQTLEYADACKDKGKVLYYAQRLLENPQLTGFSALVISLALHRRLFREGHPRVVNVISLLRASGVRAGDVGPLGRGDDADMEDA